MRLIVVMIELSFVWLISSVFGLATAYDLPIWLTALLVVLVDRFVSLVSKAAQSRRARLDEDG